MGVSGEAGLQDVPEQRAVLQGVLHVALLHLQKDLEDAGNRLHISKSAHTVSGQKPRGGISLHEPGLSTSAIHSMFSFGIPVCFHVCRLVFSFT